MYRLRRWSGFLLLVLQADRNEPPGLWAPECVEVQSLHNGTQRCSTNRFGLLPRVLGKQILQSLSVRNNSVYYCELYICMMHSIRTRAGRCSCLISFRTYLELQVPYADSNRLGYIVKGA